MITLKKTGYTKRNLSDLREILKKGLSAVMLTGKGVCTDYVDCEQCCNYYLCKDLDSTITYIGKLLGMKDS